MTGLDEFFATAAASLPDRQRWTDLLEAALTKRLLGLNAPCLHVEARAKQPMSLARKQHERLLEDPPDPRPVRDLVGLRVILAHQRSVNEVRALLEGELDVIEVDDKKISAKPNELRYLGVHLHARPQRLVEPEEVAELDPLEEFEIQLHTLAEHAWSVVSHPLVYKPTVEMNTAAQMRIYRSVALVSLFDSEVEAVMHAQQEAPEYLAASTLELAATQFGPWDDYDRTLSLDVLDVVLATLSDNERDTYLADLTAYFEQNREDIEEVLEMYRDTTTTVLLRQPESVVVRERLQHGRQLLAQRWAESLLPNDWLSGVASSWGFPVS